MYGLGHAKLITWFSGPFLSKLMREGGIFFYLFTAVKSDEGGIFSSSFFLLKNMEMYKTFHSDFFLPLVSSPV